MVFEERSSCRDLEVPRRAGGNRLAPSRLTGSFRRLSKYRLGRISDERVFGQLHGGGKKKGVAYVVSSNPLNAACEEEYLSCNGLVQGTLGSSECAK